MQAELQIANTSSFLSHLPWQSIHLQVMDLTAGKDQIMYGSSKTRNPKVEEMWLLFPSTGYFQRESIFPRSPLLTF